VFTIVDWQLISSAPPGLEFLELLFSVLNESERYTMDILREYHKILVELGPQGIEEEYTLEMVKEDYIIGTMLLRCCISCPSVQWIKGAPKDGWLMEVYNLGFPRNEGAFKAIGFYDYFNKLFEKLQIK